MSIWRLCEPISTRREHPGAETCKASDRLAASLANYRFTLPADLPFERLTHDPAVWEALIALEQLTNPRVRDEVGEIALVPPDQRVSGPGASYVMASFTHLNPKGSRFSDGSFGVYYAASELATAIAETIFHFEEFARDSGDPMRMEDMRVLVGAVAAEFENVAALAEPRRSQILDPSSYAISQPTHEACVRPAPTASFIRVFAAREANASGRLNPAPSACHTKSDI